MTPRNQVVSIELLLDADTERAVRDDWRRLSDAGLSSLAAHTSPSNRPHVTLLARRELPVTDFGAAVRQLPIGIRLGDPITFDHGSRVVLARPVRLDEPLTELHRTVHALAPPGEDLPHTAPGAWTPHVTLARRLRREAVDHARELVGLPRDGHATHMRRWDSALATVTMVS
ncbi:2'-5' RNA ligase family protein [Microbacterium sp. SLBN-146]|uniref:2'-5' RNA ligase family protein n=1 Tax=Microbacterium sp. SLBN-146 TaxID=2768457 RepID=UPI001168B4F2|nr:2'-5' RNA ligase family protein [Microbacterium sp. SLBN-146]TQJ31848.1 2'-5' RNA ligase superfamily protein [Microbacterium sp. SLBN-146]